QRLHLVLVHRHGIADAALDRLHMLGMDRAVAGEGLDLAAQADAEAHGIGRVADPDLLFQPGAQVHQPDRAVEHQVDRVAETGFAGYFHTVLLPRGAVPGAPGARRALAAVYPSRS